MEIEKYYTKTSGEGLPLMEHDIRRLPVCRASFCVNKQDRWMK